MGYPSLGDGSDICPSIRLDDGISPTRRQKIWLLRYWDVPSLGGLCLYTPWWDMLPLGSVNAYMPTGLSLQSYGSRNPPLWDVPPLIIPYSAKWFSPLIATVCCSIDEMCPPLETQILAYRLLSSEPIGVWTSSRFPLSASSHVQMMGCAPTRESSVDGITPAWEDNSADGLGSMLEVSDHRSVRGPIWGRRIRPVDVLYRHFRPYFAGTIRLWL